MKQFESTQNKTFSFSNCDACEKECCNGLRGTIFSQLILEDFEEVYENFPILFIFGELGYLKPVVILTNGESLCKYLHEGKCTIYEKRPSVCRIYPLSPNLDDLVYIDTSCPAVSEDESNIIVKDSKANNIFDFERLKDYSSKYLETFKELDQFNCKEHFSIALTIRGMPFFKYNITSKNKYMKMHQESLVHLQDDYFKNLN